MYAVAEWKSSVDDGVCSFIHGNNPRSPPLLFYPEGSKYHKRRCHILSLSRVVRTITYNSRDGNGFCLSCMMITRTTSTTTRDVPRVIITTDHMSEEHGTILTGISTDPKNEAKFYSLPVMSRQQRKLENSRRWQACYEPTRTHSSTRLTMGLYYVFEITLFHSALS